MPKIAMLEGYRGPPRGLGYTAFCSSFNAAFSALRTAYDRAVVAGVPENDIRMSEARRFIDSESGLATTFVAWGESCDKMTADASAHLGNVNAATRQYAPGVPTIGGGSLATPNDTPLGLGLPLGDIKWIVWGLAGVLALVYVGPAIKMVTGFVGRKRRGRKLNGYRRRR